jgi:hypothetical protein
LAKSPYHDLPAVLQKHLPQMFQSYPNLRTATPSSWFAWTEDKVVAHNKAICHADLLHDGDGWDEMITAVPKNDELSLEYLRMLIRGPFRSMSDLIKLDRIKDNYFLHLLSLDKWPANILMNFCIASRVPIEFHFMLDTWSSRCEIGFDPTLAWLLTYSYGSKIDNQQFNTRTFSIHRPGHMWLDPASNWKNILAGHMEKVSRPFKTHPFDSTPTNIIWGHCSDYQKLQSMTDEEISVFYEQPIKVFEAPPPPPPPPPIKKYKPGVMVIHQLPPLANLGLAPQWAFVNQNQQLQPPVDMEMVHDNGF